jgi:hypothetical protein
VRRLALLSGGENADDRDDCMLTPDNIPLFGGDHKVLPHLIILVVVIFAVLAKPRMDRETPRRD